MACFLLTHRLTAELTAERLLTEEKKVLRRLPREIKWVMTWLIPQADLVITHWDAPTRQSVLVELEHAGLDRLMPLVQMEEAIEIYPKRRVQRAHAPRHRKTRARRVWSGPLAESIAMVLQTRRATTQAR